MDGWSEPTAFYPFTPPLELNRFCQAQGLLSHQSSNLRDDPDIEFVMGWPTHPNWNCKLLIKVRSGEGEGQINEKVNQLNMR